MNGELETNSSYLTERIQAIRVSLDGLSYQNLNRAPDLPDANSPYVIATHVLGSTRAWVLGIVCGQDLRRDRPAKFVAQGSHDELTAAAKRMSADIEHALASLDPATLDDSITPPQELWGGSVAHEITRRDGLAHMLEHVGIHMGHIHITRQLLEQGDRAAGSRRA